MRSRKPLVVIFQTIFLDLLGFGLVLPLLPLYAERFGAGPLQVTSLSASYSLMQFLFVPLWGRLSDRIGRRPVLLVSIAGSFAAYTLMGLTGSLAGLFVARILSGVAGANLSAAQAAIADITPPEDRAKGMGLVGAAFGLGFIFGPFIGGTLASIPSASLPGFLASRATSFPFFASALLALVNWILAYAWLPETRPISAAERMQARGGFSFAALRTAVGTPGLILMIVLVFSSTFAFANMESTFVLWGERILSMTARQAGLLFAFIGVVMVIVQAGIVGRLAHRFGEKPLVICGTLMMSIGLLLAPLCRSYPPLLGILALLALGSGISGPSLQALISRSSRTEDQGGILGLSQSLSSLARVAGPVVAGFLFGRVGPQAPWLAGGIVMGLSLLLATQALRRSTLAGLKTGAMH